MWSLKREVILGRWVAVWRDAGGTTGAAEGSEVGKILHAKLGQVRRRKPQET
jgi:hypothetical protein